MSKKRKLEAKRETSVLTFTVSHFAQFQVSSDYELIVLQEISWKQTHTHTHLLLYLCPNKSVLFQRFHAVYCSLFMGLCFSLFFRFILDIVCAALGLTKHRKCWKMGFTRISTDSVRILSICFLSQSTQQNMIEIRLLQLCSIGVYKRELNNECDSAVKIKVNDVISKKEKEKNFIKFPNYR